MTGTTFAILSVGAWYFYYQTGSSWWATAGLLTGATAWFAGTFE